MSRPKILFLDEPTSGLDASSAMLVMQSMKTLTEVEGVTICSVIHQPRKFIFDLFDSLVLLGVGGYMVYHGDVKEAEAYFTQLDYRLPPGESVADWLIDISSGRLAPEVFDEDEQSERRKLLELKNSHVDVREENGKGTDDKVDTLNGVSRSKEPEMLESASEQEKARREFLYKCWRNHFTRLATSTEKRSLYDAPAPFGFPKQRLRPGFFQQLQHQLQRMVILASRNWQTKLVDTVLIVGGVILVSLMDGVVKPTFQDNLQGLDYYSLADPSGTPVEAATSMLSQFPILFGFALKANAKIIG
jgi:energy-coupling factor transporter ATP-binding protein EcfA2